MNDLIIFYLLVSCSQLAPLVFITVSLVQGTPFPFLTHMMRDLAPLNRGLVAIGIARLEQFFQLFDPDTLEYARKFFVLACGIQFVTVLAIILAIFYDMPFPFISNLSDVLPSGVMYELLKFSGVTAVIQVIPFLLFVLAIVYKLPLPILPKPPVHRTPPISQIARWERLSEGFASIRLTRFENLEKIIIFVNCRDDRSGAVFKLALCQAKGENARTDCYLYDDFEPTLDRITPAPISINELEDIFSLDDE